MSTRINHNISALNTHRFLNKNQDAMAKTLEKLSSGQKINRAADSPASLVISEQMRAQVAGLSQAIDNSETAISLVQTTEANMAEINNMLVSLRQLAIHASNEGVNDQVMLEADQSEIDNILQTIDRISKQAQFGNKRLLDGSSGINGTATGKGLEFVNATSKTMGSHGNGFNVKITQLASKTRIDGTAVLSPEMIDAGETLTVIENGKIAKYTTTADDTAETAIQNLRSEINRKGLELEVDLNDNGTIGVVHQEYGSKTKFEVSSSSGGVLGGTDGEITSAIRGNDIRGAINGESAIGNAQVLTGVKGAKCTDGLSIRYSGALDVDSGANDGDVVEMPAGGISVGRIFVSQNALNFQIGANSGQTAGISVKNMSTESLARGFSEETGFSNLSEIHVRDFESAQSSLKLIDNAINQVTSARGDLGAFQKNTLESNLSNLRVAHENLVSSESIIRDVDMAKEMATFTRNQIMTEASTAMLAQANQTPQSVLRLLG